MQNSLGLASSNSLVGTTEALPGLLDGIFLPLDKRMDVWSQPLTESTFILYQQRKKKTRINQFSPISTQELSASSATNCGPLQNVIDAASTMLPNIFCGAIPPPSPFFNSKCTAFSSYLDADVSHYNYTTRLGLSWRRSSRRLSPPPSGAVEKEETQFEIDREKAREALQKLDEQLQTLSQQESLPKKRPSSPSLSDLNLDRDRMTGMRIEEMPEISGSYLSYVAVALLILTIFNNIIFNAIIKPSVDGNEQASKIERVPLRDPAEQSLKQLPQ
uniref:Uncharacterized protein LOC105046525 isoform X2 n=1 Tax=Elaeis guineensis var. tenera TaxID=51953 RepID=A0A6I9RAE6_ELAGV|nr:uncharacterized protein LOC105046525 isoform X2 [Elaeis guineensis]